MASSYEAAAVELFQAPHEKFVVERKRLSLALKAQGDKAAAAKLLALNRPPVSAWAVNQLWWQERGEVESLFAAAARQRAGEREASAEHRQRLSQLRARAAELLRAAGHTPSEGTLRRVTTTLSALAAAGGFEPDLPGALSADRDPPGFETVALSGGFELAREPEPRADESARGDVAPGRAPEPKAAELEAEQRRKDDAKRAAEREAEERKQAAERERQRLEAERARREAERARLRAELERAKNELESRERALLERRKELAAAESAVEQARLEFSVAEARASAAELAAV